MSVLGSFPFEQAQPFAIEEQPPAFISDTIFVCVPFPSFFFEVRLMPFNCLDF
jgi:hypothetical protein